MDRAADYTIQGFLYQFNKTLLEVLKSDDDTEITVEGIIEDIVIAAPAGLIAIQCKYHEAKEKFTVSTLFKPLLQMMQHFYDNQQASISYILFAHFPSPPATTITKSELEAALASKNQALKKYCDALNGQIDLDRFLEMLSIEFGSTYDDLIASVHDALLAAGVANADIDTLAYPNAIQLISDLSIKHDVNLRRITKAALLSNLAKIKSTAITRWTLALKTKKQLLEARRKQLRSHLDKNARLRYFIVNCSNLREFDADIISFVCDFLAKYHFKTTHIYTPLLCFDTTKEIFLDIQVRLAKKNVIAVDGYVGPHFDEARFFRQPMVQKTKREFDLRILRWEDNGHVLAHQKGDDLFIVGENRYTELDTKDVCVEVLESSSIKEIAFTLGLKQTYE